ncbi:histidine kinase [Parapedobacter tibetensis]|uniref:histidine kinase n=1 Tax=Parapedobacter tibetensis TaxID=2972951 RepID=UPI00214DB4ED|nr:histidine kinase [Parapedobacter tibetensis]
MLSITLVMMGIGIISAQETDSWAQVQHNKGGTITALWYDIDPFIFEDHNGTLQGVEYELMESFVEWIKKKYGYEVTVQWKDAGSFDGIYDQVRETQENGVFGWSFFSITPERQKEVRFTPPYMPDINVLVTNDFMPLFGNESAFLDTIPHLHGYTMRHTAMEQDMDTLTHGHRIPISRQYDDYEILRKIAAEKNAFGYVPLTVYVVSLQKGIKVKRQHLFAKERDGLSGIFPINSDWQPVVNEYFQSFECKRLVSDLLSKYLGSEIGEIIMEGPGASAEGQRDAELELLTKEREIVSQRLVSTLLAAERDKILRNVSILFIIIVIVIAVLMYNRYRMKTHLTKLLTQRNAVIGKQNRDIERINRKLHMRVLQAQVNPHFVFNSLNDLQYYINKGDTQISLSYVSRFSRFIRELLTQANVPEITLMQEEKFLALYLNLEKMRYAGKFDYSIETDEDTPADLSGLPPLIIYHYVENALYHGILNLDGKGEINISFSYQAPHLVCTITDNGCGRKAAKERNQKRDSNDTTPYKRLLQDRIHILNDELSNRITVDVRDLVTPDGKPAGTSVVLHIVVSSRVQDPVILDY